MTLSNLHSIFYFHSCLTVNSSCFSYHSLHIHSSVCFTVLTSFYLIYFNLSTTYHSHIFLSSLKTQSSNFLFILYVSIILLISTSTIIQSTYAPLYTLINYLLFTLILSHLINSHYHNTSQTHITSSLYLFSLFSQSHLFICLSDLSYNSQSLNLFIPASHFYLDFIMTHTPLYIYILHFNSTFYP